MDGKEAWDLARPKLIVVLGTTACGKSGLGVELARRFNGEVVSADSRQVYRGLDLGTGKVTQAERMGVTHHMLDVVDPNQSYSVADFQRGAYDAIDAIRARGRTPFLVGGTGLYVRAVTEGFTFADARPDPALRAQLDTFAQEGEIKAEDVESIYARVSFAMTVEEAVAGADFIQETIVENRDAKAALYQQLAACVGPDVIIASNTSAMNIFEIVPEQLLPQQLICHWYSPPQLIPLVEVVKSEQAPQELADTAMALLKKCGKTAVYMKKFIRGYIANRLQQCINQEVFYLLEHGYCDAEAIDLAVKASFIPRACVLGLCKRMDFGGVDMTANNFRNHSYEMPHPPADEPIPHVLEEMVDRGELGIKTGKGFYDYSDVDIEELKAKRDKQLFEVFRLEKKFLDDPV